MLITSRHLRVLRETSLVRNADGQSVCPACQQELDDATGVSVRGDRSARPPRAGDIGLCAYCGQELVFTSPHEVRAMTAEEESQISEETRMLFRTIQSALRTDTLIGRRDKVKNEPR